MTLEGQRFDLVDCLVKHRRQYVIDAVSDTLLRDEQMSDGGDDSLYTERARFLRGLEQRLTNKEVDKHQDYPNILNCILRYEINKAE